MELASAALYCSQFMLLLSSQGCSCAILDLSVLFLPGCNFDALVKVISLVTKPECSADRPVTGPCQPSAD
eukprot:294830-Pelagomonas_calceolata.AAC.1